MKICRSVILISLSVLLLILCSGCNPFLEDSSGIDDGVQPEYIINKSPDFDKSIVLIIDENLQNDFNAELEVFISDLEAENYNVIVSYSDYQTPEDVRSCLQSLYADTTPLLAGAILFGQIPLARQYFRMVYTNPDIEPTDHDGLSTQFFSDLDGNFYKNNPEYPDSYSEHDGDRESEIWVSVLPWLYDEYTTINKIREYLNKNHEYRNSITTREEGFLWVNEHKNADDQETYDEIIDDMLNGDYSWSPFTEWGNGGLFINNSIGEPDPAYAYADDLQSAEYRFAALSAHGNVSGNGLLSIGDLASMSIKTPFVWLGGCNTANLDYNSNFAAELLYQSANSVLAIKGGSANAGGLGNNENGFYGHNIAASMLEGKSLGEAYLEHNNVPLVYPWSESFELHNAFNMFIGDLSLTLYPRENNDPETDLRVSFTVRDEWPNGATIDVRIYNDSDTDIDGWELSFDLVNSVPTNVWCAYYSRAWPSYTFRNMSYNGIIRAGSYSEFGMNVWKWGKLAAPQTGVINGTEVRFEVY